MSLSLRFETAPPAEDDVLRRPLDRILAASGRGASMAVALPGRVEVLDGRTLECIWSRVIPGTVHAVGLSPDGSTLAVAVDQCIKVFDRNGGERAHEVPGGACCVAFGSEGRLVAGSPSAATWLETGGGWGAFSTHERRVLCVDRRDQEVLTGGADAQVVWTDLDEGQARMFQGHTGAVRAVALLPEGGALSASTDGTVRRWETPSGRCVWSSRPPVGPPASLALVDGDLLVGGEGGLLAALDPATGVVRGVLAGHSRRVVAVGSAGDGEVWSVGQDRTARSWRRRDVRPLPPLRGHVGGVRACLLAGEHGWTGGRDGTLRNWNLRTGQELRSLSYGGSAIQALRRLPDGGLVFGTTDGRLLAVRPDGGVRWTRDPAHNGPVTSLGLPFDGPLLSGGADGVLRAWDASSGAPLWAGGWHEDRLRCLSIGKDGRVATGGYDGKVLVGEPFGSTPDLLHAHDKAVVGVAWCGECAVSGSLDGALRLTGPGGHAHQPDAHEGGVVGVHALGPDRVASVGRDGWVRLWTIPDLGMLDAVELGVPLDGLGGTHDALLVGDRRGGVHFLDVGG